ncbi:unnamed protein product [Effrenium voratum]|nr:unnamed protein product [Effrenium voratum]
MATSDFLPKEDEKTSAKEGAGGDTGGSGDDSSLKNKLNAALADSMESRKATQEQLNEALMLSRESRKMVETRWAQYTGRIRSFSTQKGFGFIDCAETMHLFGRDVFVHKNQLQESGAWVGMEVYFDVELNKSGHPQARNVMPVNPAEVQQDYGWGYDVYGYEAQPAQMTRPPPVKEDVIESEQSIEELIRNCNSTSGMQEIIERFGQHFSKRHVVTALYQLGLCRQHEKSTSQAQDSSSLTRALIDRLLQVDAAELSADEASRVQWALAALDEECSLKARVKGHQKAHNYAMLLGQQAKKRYAEFSPSQMATFVSALSRLVWHAEDDQLVGEIVTQFSEYSSGNGSFQRFPVEELKAWMNFLQEASQSQQPLQNAQANMGMGMSMQNMGMRMQGGMGQPNMNNPNAGGMGMGYGYGGCGCSGCSGCGGCGCSGCGGCGSCGGCGCGCGAGYPGGCGSGYGGCGGYGCGGCGGGGCGCGGCMGMSSQMRPIGMSKDGKGMGKAGPGMMGMAGRGADPSKGANMKADMPGFMRGPKGKGKGFDDDGKGFSYKGDKGPGSKGKSFIPNKGKGKGKDGKGEGGKGPDYSPTLAPSVPLEPGNVK